MKKISTIIFDLDQTLLDTSVASAERRKRNWSNVYNLIPSFIPYEGINQALDFLSQSYLRIGIVTSSPETYCRRILKHFNWHFDHLVCYHDTRLHKPNPEPLLKFTKDLGVRPETVLSIGDDAIDTISGKNAGVITIGALWGSDDPKELIESQPDHLIRSSTELLSLVQSLPVQSR